MLLVQNKVPVSEKSLGVMLKTMGDFKNLQDFLQDIIVKNVEYQGYEFKFSLVKDYLEKMLEKGEYETMMVLFEKIRDFQMARKATIDRGIAKDLSAVEKLQEAFRVENRGKLQSLYREMIVVVNKKKEALLYSQLLHQDMVNNKLKIESQDYINQIDSFRNSPAQVVRIYKNIVQDQEMLIDSAIMDAFLRVVQQNRVNLKDFFEKLFRDYILSGILPLSNQTICNLNFTFARLKEQSLLSEFLNFMIESDIQLSNKGFVRNSFSKAFEDCKNDSNSIILQNMIEKLFS